MMANGRKIYDKNSASPGGKRKATVATDMAAAAITKPWTIGPSNKSIAGVATISRARTRAIVNIRL